MKYKYFRKTGIASEIVGKKYVFALQIIAMKYKYCRSIHITLETVTTKCKNIGMSLKMDNEIEKYFMPLLK